MEDILGSIDISFSSLFSGFMFGVIGLWVFRQGKKNVNSYVMYIGIGLMIYPYFTHGPLADWGVGIILCLLAYTLW